jgi:hypothetical protein
MSTQLPADLAGLQHLAPDVICQEGDIFVMDGTPVDFVRAYIGETVASAERNDDLRVYRRIPCPKQGGEKVDSTSLPTDAAARKAVPIYSGFIRYFPRAIAAVAHLSHVGNQQHNPGQPLHWDRSKSGDELDALMRHLMEADGVDADGVDHLCKVAWRSMAALEKRLEKQEGAQ